MNRDDFTKLLQENDGVLIVKFTADWCAPCQKIKEQVALEIKSLPPHCTFMELNVDAHSDVYACMRSKKQVIGIPAILAYKRGNTTWFADLAVSGANPGHIANFFKVVRN